jgi:hypothetical protein
MVTTGMGEFLPLPRLFLFPLVNLIDVGAIELPIPGFVIGQLVDDVENVYLGLIFLP